jgi:hypothetical protein
VNDTLPLAAAISAPFELASVYVCFDAVASLIVNAKSQHHAMRLLCFA